LRSTRFSILCSNLNVCSPPLQLQGCIGAHGDNHLQQPRQLKDKTKDKLQHT
jgi:hypothetical protein